MSAFTSDNGHPREIKAATEALGIAIHAARATPASGRWNYCEAACLDPCAYQILHPAVLMMKSAEDQPSGKLTVRLVRSMARRIPTKGQMRPEFVVIVVGGRKDPAHMGLAKGDDVIEAFPRPGRF